MAGVEVTVRWKREDRQQPDDRPDLPAEDWLREFRPVRPDAFTAADRDVVRPTGKPQGSRGMQLPPEFENAEPGRDQASQRDQAAQRDQPAILRDRPAQGDPAAQGDRPAQGGRPARGDRAAQGRGYGGPRHQDRDSRQLPSGALPPGALPPGAPQPGRDSRPMPPGAPQPDRELRPIPTAPPGAQRAPDGQFPRDARFPPDVRFATGGGRVAWDGQFAGGTQFAPDRQARPQVRPPAGGPVRQDDFSQGADFAASGYRPAQQTDAYQQQGHEDEYLAGRILPPNARRTDDGSYQEPRGDHPPDRDGGPRVRADYRRTRDAYLRSREGHQEAPAAGYPGERGGYAVSPRQNDSLPPGPDRPGGGYARPGDSLADSFRPAPIAPAPPLGSGYQPSANSRRPPAEGEFGARRPDGTRSRFSGRPQAGDGFRPQAGDGFRPQADGSPRLDGLPGSGRGDGSRSRFDGGPGAGPGDGFRPQPRDSFAPRPFDGRPPPAAAGREQPPGVRPNGTRPAPRGSGPGQDNVPDPGAGGAQVGQPAPGNGGQPRLQPGWPQQQAENPAGRYLPPPASHQHGARFPAAPGPDFARPPRPELPSAEPLRPEQLRPEQLRPEAPRPDQLRPEPRRQESPRAESPWSAPEQGRAPRTWQPDPRDRQGGPVDSARSRTGALLPSVSPETGSSRYAENEADRVPGPDNARRRPEPLPADRDDDDTLTRPLPVILPGATSVPRPAPVEAPRGFFEPARPPGRPVSVTGSVDPPPAEIAVPAPPREMPEAAAAKLDQIKDLYLTAEAIGPDALDQHFDRVSDRQRELIREFFDRSEPDGNAV